MEAPMAEADPIAIAKPRRLSRTPLAPPLM
jgi:hypothetical protein